MFSAVAKNFSGKPQKNKVIVVTWVGTAHTMPSKSIILNRDSESSPWNEPKQFELSAPNKERFRNAFQISSKNHGTCLLIFQHLTAFVFNQDMEELSRCTYKTICPHLLSTIAASPSYSTRTGNDSEFILLHQAGEVTKESVSNYYKGSASNANTWAIRYSMDDNGTMKPINKKKEAIYLKNEACEAFLEFAPNQMIFTARPVHLFIIRDYQVTQKIDDSNSSNVNKFSLNFFPGFTENFQFLVVSGDSSFNLINTKTGHMDVLI